MTDRPCTLYRHFAGDGTLLYVGIAFEPAARRKQHAEGKPWWKDVVRTTYEHFDSRARAVQVEAHVIRTERPRWNVMHNVRRKPTKRQLLRQIECFGDKVWTYQNRGGQEQSSDLWLEWEIDGASGFAENSDPASESAGSVFERFVEECYPNGGWATILWYVMPLWELAPFQISHARHLRTAMPSVDEDWDREHHYGMLANYTWPLDAGTGEPCNFMTLPVPDRGWEGWLAKTSGSGFIQQATGWKPSALQPMVNIDMLMGREPRHYLRSVDGAA